MFRSMMSGAAAYAGMVGALAMVQRRILHVPFGGRPRPGDWGVPDMQVGSVHVTDGTEIGVWHRPAADP